MKSRLTDWLCVALLAAMGFAAGLPRYRSNMDFGDEGLLAYGAVRVLDGQIPNRDFVSLQPPLAFYTTAAAFQVFGTSLKTMRLLGLALYVMVPCLIYGIARAFVPAGFAFMAAVPNLVLGISFAHFVPVAAWQGVGATVAAALLLIWAARFGTVWLAAGAGLLTAAAVLARQDQGVYLAIASLIYFFALRFAKPTDEPRLRIGRMLGAWTAGIAVLLVPCTAYWMIVGAIPEMTRQLIIFPLTTYSKTSALPFPTFRSGLTFGPDIVNLLYYLAPPVVLCALVWLAWLLKQRAFGRQQAGWLFLAAWTGLFYCQVLVRTDLDHLLITLPPLFILLACLSGILLDRLQHRFVVAQPRHGRLARALVFAACGISVAGLLWRVQPQFLPAPLPIEETIQLSRAGVRKKGAANLKRFVERVQQYAPADRPILSLPYEPVFYFLCERRNPTRWNYLWPGDQTAADHQQLIEQARRNPPAAIILAREGEMSAYAGAILDYVHADYQLAANAGGLFSIYVPNNARR